MPPVYFLFAKSQTTYYRGVVQINLRLNVWKCLEQCQCLPHSGCSNDHDPFCDLDCYSWEKAECKRKGRQQQVADSLGSWDSSITGLTNFPIPWNEGVILKHSYLLLRHKQFMYTAMSGFRWSEERGPRLSSLPRALGNMFSRNAKKGQRDEAKFKSYLFYDPSPLQHARILAAKQAKVFE